MEYIEKTLSIWVEVKFFYIISNTVCVCVCVCVYIYIYICAVYEEVFIGMVFCVPYLFCYFLLEYITFD